MVKYKNSNLNYRLLSALLTILLTIQPFIQSSYALTSGPSQPEFKSFAPAGREDLVDLFTGDFQYNIPLFELPGPNGGYSFNLGYRSGITMEQEASWVGLGWTLNPGVINRQVRGLPDDFHGGKGDKIITKKNIEPNLTYGLGIDGNIEIFGGDLGVGTGLSKGLKVYYNNYRGFGYARTTGLSAQLDGQSGINGSVGFDFTRDSQQGLSATASLSLSDNYSANLEASINEFEGMTDLSFGFKNPTGFGTSFDALDFLGYAGPTSIPATGNEMRGTNVNVHLKFGGSIQSVFGYVQSYGFFHKSEMKDRRHWKDSKPYGYLNTYNAPDDGVLDFNREKDGQIRDASDNLAIPILTHDIYTVSAKDLTGSFRAYRNDIPIIFDKRQESSKTGGTIGVEVGPGFNGHLGIDGSLNHSSTIISRWDDSGAQEIYGAIKGINDQIKSSVTDQNYLFKFIGEPSITNSKSGVDLDRIAAEKPVFVPLTEIDLSDTYTDLMQLSDLDNIPDFPPAYHRGRAKFKTHEDASPISVNSSLFESSSRVPRTSVIQAFTNAELIHNVDVLSQFYIKGFDRTSLPEHHIGGFKITMPNGMQYIFALPVYNYKHEEHEFSTDARIGDGSTQWPHEEKCTIVYPESSNEHEHFKFGYDDTEKYLRIKKLTPYVIAYLLTAVVGPDYIDADVDYTGEDRNNHGPSDGDFGYWVKFSYTKTTDSYGWRAPFRGARFVKGYENSSRMNNDKATFTYGEKQLWYLASAETKSHFAEFKIEPRQDGKGAKSLLQNIENDFYGENSYYLKSIKLYSKFERAKAGRPTPIKEVHFDYSYDLTAGVPNNPSGGGKLTLTEVKFKYRNSGRSLLNPYVFEYYKTDPKDNEISYKYNATDRWGTYRGVDTPSSCSLSSYLDLNIPYASQNEKDVHDYAAAWNLRQIIEPSGRKISIEYESDDYAFVQNRPAMQMYQIFSVNYLPDGFDPEAVNREEVDDRSKSQGEYRKIFIPIDEELSDNQFKEKYVDDNNQVFFKIRIKLMADSEMETISGYGKVKIRTLATMNAIKAYKSDAVLKKVPTIGPTIHEFFTAKDFPVQVKQTKRLKKQNPLPRIILIPAIGTASFNSVSSSQGYSVTINDMHGKRRSVTELEYTDKYEYPSDNRHFMDTGKGLHGADYRYDQLNRLRKATVHNSLDIAANSWPAGTAASDEYNTEFTYDANGNIKTVKRFAKDTSGNDPPDHLMDDLIYCYDKETGDDCSLTSTAKPVNNRLLHIIDKLDKDDPAAADKFPNDIDHQGTYNPSDPNYHYDALGNLTKDKSEHISTITWNSYGRVLEIARDAGNPPEHNLEFIYDGSHSRVAKIITDHSGRTKSYQYYVRDPRGNLLARYNRVIKFDGTGNVSFDATQLSEFTIQGVRRLGIWANPQSTATATNTSVAAYQLLRGNKRYELTNHLNNVLATVSDLKVGIDENNDDYGDYYQAHVDDATDYFPFGMVMPGRRPDSFSYRYGFNGFERDDEIKGIGDSYYTAARLYDPRIGRWWSVDPLFDYTSTPYFSFGNNPVYYIDQSGYAAEESGPGATGSCSPEGCIGYDPSTNTTHIDLPDVTITGNPLPPPPPIGIKHEGEASFPDERYMADPFSGLPILRPGVKVREEPTISTSRGKGVRTNPMISIDDIRPEPGVLSKNEALREAETIKNIASNPFSAILTIGKEPGKEMHRSAKLGAVLWDFVASTGAAAGGSYIGGAPSTPSWIYQPGRTAEAIGEIQLGRGIDPNIGYTPRQMRLMREMNKTLGDLPRPWEQK